MGRVVRQEDSICTINASCMSIDQKVARYTYATIAAVGVERLRLAWIECEKAVRRPMRARSPSRSALVVGLRRWVMETN
jgi:hypothetical protein